MQLTASKSSSIQYASAQRRSVKHVIGPKPVSLMTAHAAAEETISTNGAVGHAATAVVDFAELSDIIRMVHDTDIIELELKSKKFNLNLRKKEAIMADQPVVQYAPPPAPQAYTAAPPPPPPAPASAAPAPAPAAGPAPVPAPPKPVKMEGIQITSPMAGTFYTSGAPGEPPFVKEGDRVTKGQVVGIVEAMKLMNQIEADIAGEVVKVLADNGSPVVAGTPLMVVRP